MDLGASVCTPKSLIVGIARWKILPGEGARDPGTATGATTQARHPTPYCHRGGDQPGGACADCLPASTWTTGRHVGVPGRQAAGRVKTCPPACGVRSAKSLVQRLRSMLRLGFTGMRTPIFESRCMHSRASLVRGEPYPIQAAEVRWVTPRRIIPISDGEN